MYHQCENDGVCSDGSGKAACQCKPDYVGEFCDFNKTSGDSLSAGGACVCLVGLSHPLNVIARMTLHQLKVTMSSDAGSTTHVCTYVHVCVCNTTITF